LSRIGNAFKSFFGILFRGELPSSVAEAYGYRKTGLNAAPTPWPATPQADPNAAALNVLAILQRDARLVDFLMEDIAGYSDDQVGAAVREMHDQSREALRRYVELAPVIDGVEGAYTRLDLAGASAGDPAAVKLLGNVPANGKVAGGTLRHKGWRATKVDLPKPLASAGNVIAPAEIEIE
jgi:hypothetical protein